MANDLVRWGRWEDGAFGSADHELQDSGEPWDRPPHGVPKRPALPGGQTSPAAHQADRDAAAARRRGDGSFAIERETDAAEHRQAVWDWGDARTWLILAGMCLVFLALSAMIYVLPFGRHNQSDGPMPVPTARYY